MIQTYLFRKNKTLLCRCRGCIFEGTQKCDWFLKFLSFAILRIILMKVNENLIFLSVIIFEDCAKTDGRGMRMFDVNRHFSQLFCYSYPQFYFFFFI